MMLNPDIIFAAIFAYFESCVLLFNNYIIIFLVYSLSTYAAEVLFKYEPRTYWYDRIITPLIIVMYLIHSYLLFDGVKVNDLLYNSSSTFNAISYYTNALAITWFVFIVAFLIYWTLRLLIYGIHLRIHDTPESQIKAVKKFNRFDAGVVLVLIVLFLAQGYNSFQNSEKFRIEREKNKAKDYTKVKELLAEAQALMKGKKLDPNLEGDNNETK